jgi:hypothetical protein
VTRYLSLAEFWYLAEHVTGIDAAVDGPQNHFLTQKADVREQRLDLSLVL